MIFVKHGIFCILPGSVLGGGPKIPALPALLITEIQYSIEIESNDPSETM